MRTYSFDVRRGKESTSYMVQAKDFGKAYEKFARAHPKAVSKVVSVWYANTDRMPVIVK